MAASPAFAEEAKDQQTVDDMVVTGTRTVERPIDVPVTIEIINRDKIEMSGATHIGDLIGKYITGHYHKYTGLLSPVGLRGFRTEAHGDDIKGYVLILVDGHRIGTGNAAKINTDRVERIEVIKGPSSALYGSAAMGGVINIITMKGDGDPGAKLSGEYGSFNYRKGQVSGGGDVNDRFSFFLTASQEEVDDYEDPKFGRVYNTEETKKNIGGNFVFALTPNHEVRLGGNWADLTGENPDWESGTYSNYDEDTAKHFDKSHRYGDLEYNGDFFQGQFHWRGLVYYLWDRNHWYWGSTDPDLYQSKYTDTTIGTDQQFTWNMTSWNKVVFGFLVDHLEKEAEGVSDGLPSVPYTPGMEYDTKALFLQDAVDLVDNRVNIIAAARYDHFDVKTVHPKTGTLATFNEKSEDYAHISPKLGIGVKFLDELLRVRANVGEGFKSPSSHELSADFIDNYGTRWMGNPDLEPETSLTYDIGFDIFHDALDLKIGYFHTDYTDKIVRTTIMISGSPARSWENRGDAEVSGFDINLEWRIGQTLDLPLELTLRSNATFNTTKEDEETGEDLLYISDYEVKSGLDLKAGGFSTQLSYALVGPQMITNYDAYPYAEEEKDSFDYWDLTLRYQFGKHWKVHASILNLFDNRVEWVRGYLQPERNYRAGVSYSF